MWCGRGMVLGATFGGWLVRLAFLLGFERVRVVDDHWIRTDTWTLPGLRWLAATYWIYRVDDDEMLRLVYDAHGAVVWQYRMLRVVRDDGTPTRHFDAHVLALRDTHVLAC